MLDTSSPTYVPFKSVFAGVEKTVLAGRLPATGHVDLRPVLKTIHWTPFKLLRQKRFQDKVLELAVQNFCHPADIVHCLVVGGRPWVPVISLSEEESQPRLDSTTPVWAHPGTFEVVVQATDNPSVAAFLGGLSNVPQPASPATPSASGSQSDGSPSSASPADAGDDEAAEGPSAAFLALMDGQKKLAEGQAILNQRLLAFGESCVRLGELHGAVQADLHLQTDFNVGLVAMLRQWHEETLNFRQQMAAWHAEIVAGLTFNFSGRGGVRVQLTRLMEAEGARYLGMWQALWWYLYHVYQQKSGVDACAEHKKAKDAWQQGDYPGSRRSRAPLKLDVMCNLGHGSGLLQTARELRAQGWPHLQSFVANPH